MNAVDAKQLAAMPRTPYAALAGSIQTGDLLLCSASGGVLAKAIKWFTGSIWTHVGICVWINKGDEDDRDDRLLLLHAHGEGVDYSYLSSYVQQYAGSLAVCRHSGMTTMKARMIAALGSEYLDRPYAVRQLGRIAMQQAARHSWTAWLYAKLRGFPLEGEASPTEKAFICSGLVANLFAKVALPIQGAPAGVFPSHCWGACDLVGVIK